MGMPIEVEIVGGTGTESAAEVVFSYFRYVDEKFSTYKNTSEISFINKGFLGTEDLSEDMKEILSLAAKTKQETEGYFDILTPAGNYDPSGIVKGWAVYNASKMLWRLGLENFYINAGGDIEAHGKNSEGRSWSVGIRNPFAKEQIVKVIYMENLGVATSGNYERGEHIYNPKDVDDAWKEIKSLTVIGPNVYEADRFVTAAFAMGRKGIDFIESIPRLEGYMIDNTGLARMTSGFEKHTEDYAQVD